MAKQAGLGLAFFVDGYDLSGDIGAIKNIQGGPEALLLTGIDKSAPERAGGLRNGQLGYQAWFNKAVGQAHPRLSLLPTTDVQATLCIGTTLGNAAASIIGKQIDYNPARDAKGNLTLDVNVQANSYGLEWGTQLTAGKRSDTTATNGTAADLLTASAGAYGAQFYLHGFSFTGTSCTVKIQDSTDNGGTDPFADVVGGGFTAITGVTAQRIATGLISVKRYLRVVTTGTFSQCTFSVMGVRNDTSVVF